MFFRLIRLSNNSSGKSVDISAHGARHASSRHASQESWRPKNKTFNLFKHVRPNLSELISPLPSATKSSKAHPSHWPSAAPTHPLRAWCRRLKSCGDSPGSPTRDAIALDSTSSPLDPAPVPGVSESSLAWAPRDIDRGHTLPHPGRCTTMHRDGL